MTKSYRKILNKPEPGNIIYFFAFTTPLFELPQLYNIVHSKSSGHVSLITWAYLALSSLAWLIYGLIKRVKPLVVSYILYTAVETSIVVSILWFK
ncbi:MAG: SemiSWEET family transporter [Candidatus Saccharimonadales bacterium]